MTVAVFCSYKVLTLPVKSWISMEKVKMICLRSENAKREWHSWNHHETRYPTCALRSSLCSHPVKFSQNWMSNVWVPWTGIALQCQWISILVVYKLNGTRHSPVIFTIVKWGQLPALSHQKLLKLHLCAYCIGLSSGGITFSHVMAFPHLSLSISLQE